MFRYIEDTLKRDFYLEDNFQDDAPETHKSLNFNQRIGQIPKEFVFEFFRELFKELLDFIMNLHLCNRYHYQFDQDSEDEYINWCSSIKFLLLSQRKDVWLYI